MDVIYQPRVTPLLALAARLNCQCVAGVEMFLNQAKYQVKGWFDQNKLKIEQ